MRIKEGASLQGLKIVMRVALMTCERILEQYGQELVVTSGTDGEHTTGSLHYYGYAVDLRTRDMTPRDRALAFAKILDAFDGTKYRAILEPSHLHVEYRGEIDD